MKFITDRIHLNPKPMAEVMEKMTKTAAKETEVKVAEKVETKVEEPKQPEVTEKVAASNVKITVAFPKPKEPTDEEIVDYKEAEEEDAAKAESEEAAEVEKVASSKKVLKLASSINFTEWKDASQVVAAWEGHGSYQKCCDNVAGKTNDPKLYCGLLQVAAKEAKSLVKSAATTKVSEVEPKMISLAKLTKEQKQIIREVWEKVLPKEYVDQMLAD